MGVGGGNAFFCIPQKPNFHLENVPVWKFGHHTSIYLPCIPYCFHCEKVRRKKYPAWHQFPNDFTLAVNSAGLMQELRGVFVWLCAFFSPPCSVVEQKNFHFSKNVIWILQLVFLFSLSSWAKPASFFLCKFQTQLNAIWKKSDSTCSAVASRKSDTKFYELTSQAPSASGPRTSYVQAWFGCMGLFLDPLLWAFPLSSFSKLLRAKSICNDKSEAEGRSRPDARGSFCWGLQAGAGLCTNTSKSQAIAKRFKVLSGWLALVQGVLRWPSPCQGLGCQCECDKEVFETHASNVCWAERLHWLRFWQMYLSWQTQCFVVMERMKWLSVAPSACWAF